MNQIWNYQGTECPFDISDADCLDRLGQAFTAAEKSIADQGEGETLSPAEEARRTCNAVRIFFSVVFGEEKSLLLCEDRQSALVCSQAYLAFLDFLNDQMEEFSKIRMEIEEKLEAQYRDRIASLADPVTPSHEA